MSGTLPLRESALAQIAARLAAQLTGVTIERARRREPDTDREAMPRVSILGQDIAVADEFDATRTEYRIGFAVIGYAVGASDLAAEQALSLLHAQVVAALAGWAPGDDALGDVRELGAVFQLYDSQTSARPAGEFEARFQIQAFAATGFPYSS